MIEVYTKKDFEKEKNPFLVFNEITELELWLPQSKFVDKTKKWVATDDSTIFVYCNENKLEDDDLVIKMIAKAVFCDELLPIPAMSFGGTIYK